MCRNLNIQPGIFIKGLFCRELNALHDEYEQKKISKKSGGVRGGSVKAKKWKIDIRQNLTKFSKKIIFFYFFWKPLRNAKNCS